MSHEDRPITYSGWHRMGIIELPPTARSYGAVIPCRAKGCGAASAWICMGSDGRMHDFCEEHARERIGDCP
jgi:hypothetical protein